MTAKRIEGRAEHDDLTPEVEITEAEYRKNPLAADVKYWGHWVLGQARKEIGQYYPADSDGSVPAAYLWARTSLVQTLVAVRRSHWCDNSGCATRAAERWRCG